MTTRRRFARRTASFFIVRIRLHLTAWVALFSSSTRRPAAEEGEARAQNEDHQRPRLGGEVAGFEQVCADARGGFVGVVNAGNWLFIYRGSPERISSVREPAAFRDTRIISQIRRISCMIVSWSKSRSWDSRAEV
jgi:hypothetical protein